MGIQLYREPELNNPIMLACWPGIANIGIMAFDSLRVELDMEELGEIEPWDFSYPSKVIISNGEIKDLEFPSSRFFFKRTGSKDLIFFIGEEQPTDARRAYAEGEKAYQMANHVLDVAQRFGCTRVITSGAAVAPIHHTAKPRVWAVPNTKNLIGEIRKYPNTILMSDIEERGGEGNITGLNGLLLGVARKRQMDAICLMGEIPIYLQGFPFPYPKASKSLMEILGAVLEIDIDMSAIDALITNHEREIDHLYARFPDEIREQLDKLKDVVYGETSEPGPITEEDKRRILEDIDKFFEKGPGEGLR